MATLKSFVSFSKKVICVGRNYREHAAELGNPVPTEPFVFLKPPTSFITEGMPIKLPLKTEEIHHEVELGLIIGQKGFNIPESQVMNHVGGYILALDMTDRGKQAALKKKGLPWAIAKGFDTSCPVSDFIPKEKIPDPQNVPLWLKVNGEMKQNGNTKDMIFTIPNLVSWISQHFTLEPGDVVLTGTPSGVGPVKAGDVIDCGLADIISMKYKVEGR